MNVNFASDANRIYGLGRSCLVALIALFAAVASADEAGLIVRQAVAGVAPSAVRIRMIGNAGSDLAVSSRVTTGIVISEEGYVLTSAFGFTGQSAAVFVEDSVGDRVAAKVVAIDHVRKLVLLRCEEGRFVLPQFSRAAWPAVGASAIAVGRMYSGEPSVSVGVVSAVNRIFGLAIQTDAKISPVNYGGPLLNLDGDVLGILVPLSPGDSGDDIEAGVEWYDSGIGFAIPINEALQAANLLRNGEDRVRGVLGVGLSTRNPLEAEFSVKLLHPDSPASEADLKVGDQIVEANGVAIQRYGQFESVMKSSYAGDHMQLRIQRGDETLSKEMTLAAELVRSKPGFWGMVIGELVKADDDTVLGVQIQATPESPMAEAGLPSSVVLTHCGDTELKSVEDLVRVMRSCPAGKPVALKWVPDQVNREEQETVVTPVQRPASFVRLPAGSIADLAGTTEAVEWQRGEKNVGDNAGQVWFYAPKTATAASSGLVVLLSAGNVPQETILNRWKEPCELHNLILVVPVDAENTGLTKEHREFIPQAVAVALATAEGRRIDQSRSVLIAEADQAEVCTGLILQVRRRMFPAAVFVDSWPQVSGIPAQLLSAASPSSLIVSRNTLSRQRLALQQQAILTLKESGAWVVQQAATDDQETSTEEDIANWILNLRIR